MESSSTEEPGQRAAISRDARRQSDLLHERVQRFVHLCDVPPLVPLENADTFESLALDIARFQLDQCAGLARLLQATGGRLESTDDIPAVPVDAFRLTRVAAHPSELDIAVFETSGTTNDTPGRHPLRRIDTLDELSLTLAKRSLFARTSRALVVALAPEPGLPARSSLGHMMRTFMEHFDGRALVRDPVGARFSSRSPERWLLDGGHLDLAGLSRAAAIARERSEPLVILSTAFALAACVEQLDTERLRTPSETFVMVTGGFKGRRTSLSLDQLRGEAARAFGISESAILGEYGMTELTSQLYEGWSDPRRSSPTGDPVAEALRPSWWPHSGRPGVYFAPPWLRVQAVDPLTGRPVAKGQVGLARFVALGHVDSAIAIVTEDQIVEVDGGIELLGRRPSARPRGCSLPYEGLLGGSASSRGGPS